MGPKKATKAAVLKKMKVVKGQQQFSAPLSIRCQVMPSGRVGRPKRDKVPARFNLVPEAIGLSWAEEADLNRALYASIKGKKRRKRAAAAQCRSCPRKDSTSGSATSGSADYGAAASHEPSKATKRRSASCGSPVTKRPHAQRKFAQGGASPDIDFYGQQVSPSPRLQQQQGAARKATSGNLTLTPVFADENGPTIYTEDLVKYLCYRNSPANMNFRSMAPFVNSASYRKTAPAAPANGTRSMSLSCEPHGGNMQSFRGGLRGGSSGGRSEAQRPANSLLPSSSSSALTRLTAGGAKPSSSSTTSSGNAARYLGPGHDGRVQVAPRLPTASIDRQEAAAAAAAALVNGGVRSQQARGRGLGVCSSSRGQPRRPGGAWLRQPSLAPGEEGAAFARAATSNHWAETVAMNLLDDDQHDDRQLSDQLVDAMTGSSDEGGGEVYDSQEEHDISDTSDGEQSYGDGDGEQSYGDGDGEQSHGDGKQSYDDGNGKQSFGNGDGEQSYWDGYDDGDVEAVLGSWNEDEEESGGSSVVIIRRMEAVKGGLSVQTQAGSGDLLPSQSKAPSSAATDGGGKLVGQQRRRQGNVPAVAAAVAGMVVSADGGMSAADFGSSGGGKESEIRAVHVATSPATGTQSKEHDDVDGGGGIGGAEAAAAAAAEGRGSQLKEDSSSSVNGRARSGCLSKWDPSVPMRLLYIMTENVQNSDQQSVGAASASSVSAATSASTSAASGNPLPAAASASVKNSPNVAKGRSGAKASRVQPTEQQCSGKANQKNGSSFVSAVLLHDVAQVLPEADRDDPLGSYIYAKLLGSDLSERFVSSHDSHTFTLQEVRDYARTELKYRAELRSKSVRVDELQPPKRGKRSNTAPPVPPLPPYTCSVTKYNCHLSVVFAAGDLISTRYAALLASGLTRDPTACLYTLVTDDLLQSLCKEGNKH